jgi:hypothetical protein
VALKSGVRSQETVVLGDEGDLAAEALGVPTVERLAVDQHPAAGRLVEPRDDLDERGLAAAGGPRQGHELTGTDGPGGAPVT